MSVAGHHVPVWFDEATGPDDGDVSVWNSATGRFESAPVVGGAIPDGTLAEVPVSGTAAVAAPIGAGVYDNFERAGPGLGTAPSGQAWTTSGAGLPTISGGKLVGVAGQSSSYAEIDCGVTPESFGAEWTIEAGATTSNVTLICSIDTAFGLSNMLHLLINSATWNLQLRQAAGSFDTVASGAIPAPLATDGTTLHRAVVAISGDTIFIVLPDGSTAVATDSRVSDLVGPRLIFQPATNANGSQAPRFTRIFANLPQSAQPLSGFAYATDMARGLANKIGNNGNQSLAGNLYLTGSHLLRSDHPSGFILDVDGASAGFLFRNLGTGSQVTLLTIEGDGDVVALKDFKAGATGRYLAAHPSGFIFDHVSTNIGFLFRTTNGANTLLAIEGVSGHITPKDGANVVLGTTTGTKIGTATTQKIGLWNATPVVQPAGIADVSGGAIIDAEVRTAFNTLLAKLETVGLLAVA